MAPANFSKSYFQRGQKSWPRSPFQNTRMEKNLTGILFSSYGTYIETYQSSLRGPLYPKPQVL